MKGQLDLIARLADERAEDLLFESAAGSTSRWPQFQRPASNRSGRVASIVCSCLKISRPKANTSVVRVLVVEDDEADFLPHTEILR